MDQKTEKKLEEIIRVNHAGELGAQDIYKNQIKFCKDGKLKKELEKISQEEKIHYDYFENLILKKRIRPTLMSPAWKVGSFFLGAITSRLGPNYVYACTEAVEEVIVKHYQEQIEYLEKNKLEEKLKKKIKKFCKEEDQHRTYADQSIVKDDLALKVFKGFTKSVTKLAIEISKKI